MRLGVYAIEQDYSQYVATASEIILAIVGTATKGPINTPTVVTSPTDLANKFGKLTPNCLGLYAASYFLNQSPKIWYVRAASSSAVESSVEIAGASADGTAVTDTLVVKTLDKGSAYDGYKIVVADVSDVDDTFSLTIKNAAGTTVESMKGISFSKLSTNFTSKYISVDQVSDAAAKLTAGEYTLAGGNDGIEDITPAEYILAGNTLLTDNVDMNMLSVPGVSDIAVVNAMLQLVETRKDSVYIIDPPNNLSEQEVADWHNGQGTYTHAKLNSSYGALYYSWQNIYDPVNGIYVEIPPSIPVTAAIANSTKISEIWYPPAGLKRGLIKGVLSSVTSPDTGAMNNLYTGDNSVNCIINDPQVGLCIFGQKTLHRVDSALNRLNVRLLMNYLKRIVVAACRHLVFEPNDRVTWNNFEDLIEPTLKSIKNRRGIYEYKIVKGESIVTPDDIDNYRMPCMILIRPTKAAEDIPIYFTITNTGADFNDVLANNGIGVE